MNSADSSAADPAAANVARRLAAGLLVLTALVCSVPAFAQETVGSTVAGAIVVERIEVGLDGHYKVAEWTPLRLVVRTPSAMRVTILVEAPDSDDNPTTFTSRVFDVVAGEPQRLETVFRTGRLLSEIVFHLVDAEGRKLLSRRLRAGGDESAALRPAMRHDAPLWLTFADLPDVLGPSASVPADTKISGAAAAAPSDELRVVRLTALAELPGSPLALRSVDLLVLPTARRAGGASLLDQLTPDQDVVLREWVRGGGHLMLTVASEEAAYRASSLAAWVPARVEGPAALRQLVDLERYSETNLPLKFSGTLKGARLSSLPDRNAPVKDGGNPLIAAVPCGFGQVTLIGLDIESPPVSNWGGLPAALRKLVGGPLRTARKQTRQANRQLTQTGITDLATQIQTAHEDFPDVARPSHWWVMGLLVAWLVVICPLDYLLVNRWLRRPELTWFTLPLLVCLGAAAAAWGARRINDRNLQFNQFDLVDFDALSKTVRGRSWVSVYSPENRRFAVAVESSAEVLRPVEIRGSTAARPRLSWSGVPENSVSGVYRSGGNSLGGRPFRFAAEDVSVENLPVLQWSTKSLSAEWQFDSDDRVIEGQIESAGAGQLTGALTHHLPATLEDCLFVVGGWAYAPVGDKSRIAPGVPWQPGGPQARARDLKALLTGERRTRQEKDKLHVEVLTTTSPYDPLNRNDVDLIQMLSFHQAAGGSDYTGLANAALRDLELTHLMELGRGILVGRVSRGAARVRIDGATPAPTDGTTFVRIVIPVKHRDRNLSATIPKLGERDPQRSTP